MGAVVWRAERRVVVVVVVVVVVGHYVMHAWRVYQAVYVVSGRMMSINFSLGAKAEHRHAAHIIGKANDMQSNRLQG